MRRRWRRWRRHRRGDHGTLAYRCEGCDRRDPKWSILRRGDAVGSWACDRHLDRVCEALQRDHEVTALVVTLYPKAVEWAEIGRSLSTIAEVPQ